MKATIKAEDGLWSVYLGTELVLWGESYAVADNLAFFLNTPHARDHSECAAMATNIEREQG